MDRSIPAIITALVLLGILILMWRSWRKRSRRDAALTAGYPISSAAGVALAVAEAYYVATTPRDAPLERLAIPGLGFRARAALTVTGSGVTLDLDGNQPVFVPASAIDAVGAAQVAIDRAVETDGLVRLSWRLNSSEGTGAADDTWDRRAVDSFFRIIDPNDRARLVDSIRTIAATNSGPAAAAADQDESEA
ncbi:MAG: hypothetical protein LH475_14295 [Cryobacterium sp.]|uniref:PH-like domain-containing protein n=1 Tax=unclassified Cryobacterium TaxID=2649013 RepID=UPI0018CA87B9|nr:MULTISPECIES: hypothetical protein [unclassified Cryobacterium]MCY7405770.1 hypothetical protein [Cryobacterium sp.]MEC5155479.1 hypothetical protein [Cryobacterium sp. CAN_C3]